MHGFLASRTGAQRATMLAFLICATVGLAHPVAAQTVYTYTGEPFTSADPPYTTGDRLQGAFSVAVPLAPFTVNSFVDVLDYSFSDGVVTFTPANSVPCSFRVSTDGAGHITAWSISLREPSVNMGDPQQFMDTSNEGDQAGFAPANFDTCDTLVPTAIATSNTPGTWLDDLPAGTPTTYTFTGDPFTNADPPYTTNDRVTGSIVVAAPLPDLLPSTEIGFALEDFSFSDGVQTRTPANTVVCSFEVATNPAGNIIAWSIGLRERDVLPSMPQQIMDLTTLGDQVGSAPADADPCAPTTLTLVASNGSGGTWTDTQPPGVPITYTYTGNPFDTAAPPYTTSDRLTGSIDLADALPPFVADQEIGPALENFSFSDGVQTRTPANSIVCRFRVSTDGEGNIIQWLITLRQVGVNPGDPVQTMDSSVLGDIVGSGPAPVSPCDQIGLTTAADTQNAGTWGAPLPPADAIAYAYEGDPVTEAQAPYSIGDRLLGRISVAGRLPANFALADITPALLDLTFEDGQQTRTLADTVVCSFRVGTDALGNIVQWSISLREAGVPPGNTQHAVDSLNQGSAMGDIFGFDAANADPCGNLVLMPRGSVNTAGTWITETPNGPAEIPTLSEIAAALLASLLALAGLAVLRQRG